MKMIKSKTLFFVIALVLSLACFSICYADTKYYYDGEFTLTPYPYGCNLYASGAAVEADYGAWENVTGVKLVVDLYRNNIKVISDSDQDTTSPYKAEVSFNTSSNSYSNTWKAIKNSYFRMDSQWKLIGTVTRTESN